MTATPYTYRAIGVISGGPLRALPGSTVTVYFSGTTTKAVLFNFGGSIIANPMTADSSGNALFYTAPGIYDIVAQVGAFIDTCTIRIGDSSSGTNADSFRGQGNGTDLAALQAATAYAIANSAWPIRIPSSALPFQLNGGVWYINSTGNATGGPVDSIHIVGDAVGDIGETHGASIIGDVWIGCGPAYTSGGNKPDPSTLFISRAALFENCFVDGSVTGFALQKNSRFANINVKPSSNNKRPNGQLLPGLYLAFCNTMSTPDCRCDNAIQVNGIPARKNCVVDTCQDLDFDFVTFNTGATGVEFVQEFDYTIRDSSGNPVLDATSNQQSTNPNGYFGSSRCVGVTGKLHLEQNYGVAFSGKNVGAGAVYVRIIQQATTDWTQPRAIIGDDLPGDASAVNFKVNGNINGGKYATADCIGLQLNYAGYPIADAGLRIENVGVGIRISAGVQRPNILSGVSFDASVAIPVQLYVLDGGGNIDPTATAPSLQYLGFQVAANNAPANSIYAYDLTVDARGARQTIRRCSDDPNGPSRAHVKYRGSPKTPAVVLSGDRLSLETSAGYDGSATQLAHSRSVNVIAATPGPTDMAGQIIEALSKPGSISPSQIEQLDWSGFYLFGFGTPIITPEGLYRFPKTFTLAAGSNQLPSAVGRLGSLALVSDPASGFGPVVRSNGSSWYYVASLSGNALALTN